jgi:hypothetical protein
LHVITTEFLGNAPSQKQGRIGEAGRAKKKAIHGAFLENNFLLRIVPPVLEARRWPFKATPSQS